jgi:hypothetical protein
VYANRADSRPATFGSSPRTNVASPRTGVVGANSSYVRPTPGTAVPRNSTAGGFNTQPAARGAAPLYQALRSQSPIRPIQPRSAATPQVQQFRQPHAVAPSASSPVYRQSRPAPPRLDYRPAPAQPSSPSHGHSFSRPAPSSPRPSSHANVAAPRGHSSSGGSTSAPRRR